MYVDGTDAWPTTKSKFPDDIKSDKVALSEENRCNVQYDVNKLVNGRINGPHRREGQILQVGIQNKTFHFKIDGIILNSASQVKD